MVKGLLIYEEGVSPLITKDTLWVRLYVHKKLTKEDELAVSSFGKLSIFLAEHCTSEGKIVLTIFRLNRKDAKEFKNLPCICSDNKYYEGYTAVRNHMFTLSTPYMKKD